MENIPDTKDVQAALPDISSLEYVDSCGFKAVYKGVVQGNPEAIKLIYVPVDEDEDRPRDEIVARVRREIEVLRICQTDKLVKLGSLDLDIITIGRHDYLLYSEEFIEGENLRARVKKAYVPDYEELKLLTSCIMEAVNEIEKTNHIHRDIKPGNVMATGNPTRPFILLDLGVAFKLHGTDLTAKKAGPPGTLKYIAPELLRPDYKNYLDIRSDIYSAGVTIFEYASGRHPISRPEDDPHTTIYRILYTSTEKLGSYRSDLPEGFCRMIDRCIKKKPALRFLTPNEIINCLEGLS